MIKAILFDIDNTLYDSTTLATMARRNSVKSMIDAGLAIKDEEEVYEKLQEIIKSFGSNYPRHYDKLLEHLGLPWSPKIVAAGVVAYEHTKFGYLKPFPGVVPALIELEEDFKLGIVSNGIAVKQWEKLVGLGIHHFFDVIVTSEEVGVEKPGREIFLRGSEKLGVKASECIMVGDRIDVDISGAKAAGMKTVWIKRGLNAGAPPKSKERPDHTAESFFELLPLIRSIAGG